MDKAYLNKLRGLESLRNSIKNDFLSGSLRKDWRDVDKHSLPIEAIMKKAQRLDQPETSTVQLGTGSFGSAFRDYEGNVTKYDSSRTEPQLYSYLRRKKRLNDLSIIPKSHHLGRVSVPVEVSKNGNKIKTKKKVSVIGREDLKNVRNWNLQHHLDTLGQELGTKMGDLLPNNKSYQFKTTDHVRPEFIRSELKSVIRDWHDKASKDVTDQPDEGDDKNPKILKRIASDMYRLIHHGIIPGDLHSDNWGQRQDGSVAIRDLGVYKVIPDVKKEKPQPTNISRNVNKLRSLNGQNTK